MKVNANEINADLKSKLKDFLPKEANSVLWECSKAIATKVNRDLRSAEKEMRDEFEVKRRAESKALTDEERSEKLTEFLDGKLIDGSLTAAELAQFKDIYGLKAKDRDISIEIVDFRDVYPEGAKSIDVAAEHIKMMIAEANEELHN